MTVGRVLISALFLISGFGMLMNFQGTVGMIASAGIPMATVATAIALFLKVGGALMLLTGFHARLGAWMLIVFVTLASFTFHTNWADQTQMIMFLKNVSIIGGLLYVAKFGPGAFSIHKHCMMPGMCPDCKDCEDCKTA